MHDKPLPQPPTVDDARAVPRYLPSSLQSMVAGISGFTRQSAASKPPEIDSHASQEAFEKYKAYNTQTNVRVRELNIWGDIAERIAGSILTGATIVIGGTVMAWLGGGVLAGALALTGLIGVSLAVSYAIRLPSVREQSDKGMDVSDFNVRRQAVMIAQELKKALSELPEPQQGSAKAAPEHAALVMREANTTPDSPSTQIRAKESESHGKTRPTQPDLHAAIST